MNIAIGADHHGIAHKEYITKQVQLGGHTIVWHDLGTYSNDQVDYPGYAVAVSRAVASGEVDMGILLCGTGVGMAIVANRFDGIFAALAWNEQVAQLSAEHDQANILVLPADFVTPEQSVMLINAWLSATFQGDRHERRIVQIEELGGIR